MIVLPADRHMRCSLLTSTNIYHLHSNLINVGHHVCRCTPRWLNRNQGSMRQSFWLNRNRGSMRQWDFHNKSLPRKKQSIELPGTWACTAHAMNLYCPTRFCERLNGLPAWLKCVPVNVELSTRYGWTACPVKVELSALSIYQNRCFFTSREIKIIVFTSRR